MIKARVRMRDRRRVYDVRLRDPAGKVYTRTFETKREAEAFQDSERNARRKGAWVDPRLASTSLSVVADDWLQSDRTKKGGSIARDRSILNQHVLPVLGVKAVGAITRADIQKLVNGWAPHFAPSTIGRMYSCVRALFSFAELGELIVRSPCRNIRVPESAPRKAQILDGDDLARLAAAMGDTGLMIYLAALGPRWGEIAGLRVGKIDFLRSTITIATQRTRGERGAMVEQDPKSVRGSRTFTAPDWIMDLLADHLAARSLTGADSQELVFVTPNGAPMHYSNWRRRVWVRATEEAGFPGLHFHDVRKTAATTLVDEGVDIKTAQTRLGHTEQVMLRVYAQATERADRAAAEKIGDRFRPARSTRDGSRTRDANASKRRPQKGA
jgi:integrase